MVSQIQNQEYDPDHSQNNIVTFDFFISKNSFSSIFSYAVVTTTIRLQFDGATTIRRPVITGLLHCGLNNNLSCPGGGRHNMPLPPAS